MTKRSSSQAKKTPAIKHKKNVKHYLQVYGISLIVGLIVFVVGSFLMQQKHPPCANSRTCKSDLSFNIDNNAVGMFQGHKVLPPKIDIAHDLLQPKVLGDNVPVEEKHIYVDLSTQTLYAYEGTTQIMKTLIASGKWGKTPIGNFNIWEKLRSTRMAGGEGYDAYDLPNVPFVMYFYNDFGLHGAYWHDNYGHPMSHGCVNMRPIDAEALFNWADGPTAEHKGTAVSICNQFSGPNICIQNNPIN
ncbi:MAG TPA: L,D-transpeptidase [Candidatus Saccharimonadales bacterium]|nr:L,D-transpeptidase [Candidatus Saccharimonadales bacterium]